MEACGHPAAVPTNRGSPALLNLLSSSARAGLKAISVNEAGLGFARAAGSGTQAVLEAFDHRPVPEGQRPEEALRRFVKDHRLGRGRCATVRAPGEYKLRLVDAPRVPPAELRAAVRWQVKDLIDFHIDDAVVDVFDAPSTKRGDARYLYTVVAHVNTVRARIDLLRNAGVEPEVIDIPELVLRNLAARLPEDPHGVAMLHIVNGYGVVTVTRDAQLYLARTLDVALNRLRASAGDKVDHGAVEPVALEIQRTLDYYDSHFQQGPVSSLALAPCRPSLPGLAEVLGEQLNVRVRTVALDDVIRCRSPVSPEDQAQCWLTIGAALRDERRAY